MKRVWPCLSLYLSSQNTFHDSAHCEIKNSSCFIFRFVLSNDALLMSFHCSMLAFKWAYLPKFLLKELQSLSMSVKLFKMFHFFDGVSILAFSTLYKQAFFVTFQNINICIQYMVINAIVTNKEVLWLDRKSCKQEISFSEDWESAHLLKMCSVLLKAEFCRLRRIAYVSWESWDWYILVCY